MDEGKTPDKKWEWWVIKACTYTSLHYVSYEPRSRLIAKLLSLIDLLLLVIDQVLPF